MTQLIILGGILTGFVALFMYVSNNKENYVRKEEPPNDPLNVIYLPADLDAQKETGEAKATDETVEAGFDTSDTEHKD